MKKNGLMIVTSLVLTACGALAVPPEQMPITTEKREFVFDYTVSGKSQQDLYRAARNYLATVYGDSRAVSRIEDSEQGTIIGKGISSWNLSTSSPLIPSIPCSSNYDLVFIAKDGRARLQLALREGRVVASECGWTLPPKRDYPQIVAQFEGISKGMEKALTGQAPIDTLRNF